MCFSAGASFVGSVAISAVGVATTREVSKKTQRLFAGIPLLFGFQQFAEGLLWVALGSGGQDLLQNIATYAFLIMALIIWPTMIPLSMWFMEKDRKRKKIIKGLVFSGSAVSLFYIYGLIFYEVTPRVSNMHIQYLDTFPSPFVDIALVLYLASTIVPLFVSSVKRMWLFGAMIAVAYIVTAVFFQGYLTSVWCFFAAALSMMIYWILRGTRTTTA